MDSHQRRAAGGVDRHGRPFEPEREGNAAGDRVERIAGDEVGLDLVDRLGRQQVCVFISGHPCEDAGSAATQRRRRVPGPLQTFPDRLEHEPLLRLDPDGFAGRDTEEFRVESVDAVEESAETCVGLARHVWVGVVELVDVEAVFGDFADRVDAAGQQIPERFRVGRTGEAARYGDDRDRLVGAGRDRGRQRRSGLLFAQLENVAE